MAEHWFAMASAPRNGGTVILVVYDDFCGVSPAYWSEEGNGIDGPGWYGADDGYWVGDAKSLAGWLPCPQHSWPCEKWEEKKNGNEPA